MGESKTAQERITRYAGGFVWHFSQVSAPFVGMPHLLQKGLRMSGIRPRQSGHQRQPAFPHPAHTGGKSKSNPLQVNRYRRYDQGMLFTRMINIQCYASLPPNQGSS